MALGVGGSNFSMGVIVGAQIREFNRNVDKAIDKTKEFERSTGRLGRVASRGFDKMQTVGKVALGALASGAAVAGGAMVTMGVKGVNAARDLEAQMSDVAAVLGTSGDEMDQLNQLVLDLGIDPNLKVNATEAAQSIELLARNGLTAEQILDGAARSTVLLANATGAEFGTAADIATDAMAQFNIEVDDMGGAVDGITSVVNASKFSIDDYRLALGQAGGVAGSVGVEFDDFNTAIASMASNFASGSDAGTSFKTMLQRMVPVSGPAEEAMRELGIITDETGNKFFDAQGNMRSMSEVAGILNDALNNVSEEDRNRLFSKAFGTDAMRAAIGLAESGKQGFQELQAQMGETDAIEGAATRMDNLSGAIEILQGIVETITIRIGQALTPAVRSFVEAVSVFLEQHSDQIVAVFERLATGIERVVGWLTVTAEAIRNGGWQELFTTFEDGSTRLEGLIEAFGATETQARQVATTINDLVQRIREMLAPIVNAITKHVEMKDVLAALAVAIGAVVVPAIVGLIASITPIIATFAAVVAASAALRRAWETNFLGIRDKAQVTMDFINRHIPTVMDNIEQSTATSLENMRGFWQQHGDTVTGITDVFMNVVRDNIENELAVITGLMTAWQAARKGDWFAFGEAFRSIWDETLGEVISLIADALPIIWDNITELTSGIINRIQEIDWGDLGHNIIQGIADGVGNAAGLLVDAARRAASAAWDAIRGFFGIMSPSTLAMEAGAAIDEGLAIGMMGGAAPQAAHTLAQQIADGFTDIGRNQNLRMHMRTGAQAERATGAVQPLTDTQRAAIQRGHLARLAGPVGFGGAAARRTSAFDAPQQNGGGGDSPTFVTLNVGGSVVTERDLVASVRRGLKQEQRANATVGFS